MSSESTFSDGPSGLISLDMEYIPIDDLICNMRKSWPDQIGINLGVEGVVNGRLPVRIIVEAHRNGIVTENGKKRLPDIKYIREEKIKLAIATGQSDFITADMLQFLPKQPGWVIPDKDIEERLCALMLGFDEYFEKKISKIPTYFCRLPLLRPFERSYLEDRAGDYRRKTTLAQPWARRPEDIKKPSQSILT